MMKTSENINELATALSKAQSEMTGAVKSTKNFFKSTCSDLASVCAAISKPFSDNGLSFIQSPEFSEQHIQVVTRIMHSSGQWIEGVVTLPPTKNDAQGYGSAITYGRRYGLQAMAGVPSVDDDGQDAVKHKTEKPAKPVLIESNKDMWSRAVTAFINDGNLNRVLASRDISPEDQAKIISQAQALQYEQDAQADHKTTEAGA